MEKTEPVAATRRVDESDSDIAEAHTAEAPAWKPGYAERFPVWCFIYMCVVALCAAASCAILIASNNHSSTKWGPLTPNVCLQAINKVSDFALAAAVTQGIAIAWWRKASKGATVAQLHRSWQCSTGMSKIIQYVWTLDTVALAALAVYLSFIYGFFFQKANGTYVSTSPAHNVPGLGIAATEFPKTGYVVAESDFGGQAQCGCFMIGDAYNPVVNTWQTSNGFFAGYNDWFRTHSKQTWYQKLEQRFNKHIADTHCDGTCYTELEAIGFEIDCSANSKHDNIAAAPIAAYQAAGNGSSGSDAAWSNIPIFNSSFVLSYPPDDDPTASGYLELRLHYFQSQNPYDPNSASCPGEVFDTTCRLHPALVTYPVKITNYTTSHIVNGVSLGTQAQSAVGESTIAAQYTPNSTIAFQDVPVYNATNKQAEGIKVQKRLTVRDDDDVRSLTALGGIANALHLSLASSATISYTPGDGDDAGPTWSLAQDGMLAQTMMFGPPNMGSCDCSFRKESLDVIVQSINELTFLTAIGMIDHSQFSNRTVAAGEQATVIGVNKTSTATFHDLTLTQISDVVFYKTNYYYLAGAVVAVVVCMLLVVPSFWYYGELGRNVTLGPIEVANAFHAPVLVEDTQSAKEKGGDIDTLIHNVGHRHVQYGFVDEHTQASTSGADGKIIRHRSVRLEIAEPNKVRPVSGIWASPPNSPAPHSTR